MTVDTKEVVTTIAYMIGVRMSALTASYGECAELIDKLKQYVGMAANSFHTNRLEPAFTRLCKGLVKTGS